jgi:hypothetical protein
MTEAPRTPSATTTELPTVPPGSASPAAGASAAGAPAAAGASDSVTHGEAAPAPGPAATGPIPVGPPPAPPQTAETPAPSTAAEGQHATAPVTGRPRVGPRRVSPLTRMGPWAPVAGALLGLLGGLLVVLLLRGVADAFQERLALVFLTVGLGMLGASGALLADEVRLVRRSAREAGIRPAWVEATANLINGLTPARLLLLASAFVLFLAAYVS